MPVAQTVGCFPFLSATPCQLRPLQGVSIVFIIKGSQSKSAQPRARRDTGGETVGNPIPDEEQITKLYQEMYGRMVAYASSVLGDRNLAEEVVQDTFCIFCMKAEDALRHKNPQGWLMRTLQNVMRNMQRHRAAMNRLILKSLQAQDLEELLVYDEKDVDLLYGDLAARADFQLLKRVVLDGCTMLEAAEEYGITVEACKKRIQRLRAHLKKKLSDL